jgi:hypothetical protein
MPDSARSRFQDSKQVTLDATGNGFVRFQPTGENWEIDSVSVSADSTFRDATCRIYQGQIGAQYKVDETFSGSSGDTSDTVYHVADGEGFYIEWTDADDGSTVATAVIRGWRTIPNRGFRAV